MKCTMGPTANAATTVPSRTPYMPDMKHTDSTHAVHSRVMSKPNLTYPNSLLKCLDMVRTRYSPAIIAALALTSNAIPMARIIHPISRKTILLMYSAGLSQNNMFMDISMNVPKHNAIGICSVNILMSDFNSFILINGNSNMTKRMFMAMVHCPIVHEVNMLSTYVTLVIGEVPSIALVMNAIPNALMNRDIAKRIKRRKV